MNEEDTLPLDCSGHFADSDGSIVNCVPIISYHFTIKKINDFLYLLIPEQDFYGIVSVVVSAHDDSGGVRSASFDLTVKRVDDPPVFFQSIRDTSIRSNDDLRIQLKPILKDVDDPFYTLKLTATTPNYFTYYSEDTALVFQPMGFVDTARITIKAIDSARLFDTASFLLFTNNPVPLDSTFTICRANWSGFCYASIENATDSALDIYGFYVDRRLYYDSYSINGRKRRQTKFLNLPDCNYQNGGPQLTALTDNRFFLTYPYGTGIGSWRTLLLDSNLTIKDTCQTAVSINSVNNLTEIQGKIFVFGRYDPVSPCRCFYVDVFDTNLSYIRSDTVSKQAFVARSIRIFPTSQGYTVFWIDSVIDDQFYTQLFAESFTAEGKILAPKKRILPYIQRSLTNPLNFDPSVKIIRRKSGKYLTFWSMDDGVNQSGGSYGAHFRPQVYAIEVDSNLTVSTTYSTVVPDSVEFRQNKVTYAYDWGNKIMVVWRNSGGNGDPVYMRYQAFDSDLQPITRTFSDDLAKTEYQVLNDSIIFRLDRSDPKSFKASFRKNLFKDNPTAINPNRQSKNSVPLKLSDYSRIVSVKVFDLLGRKCALNRITCQKNRFSGLPHGVMILGIDAGGQLKLKKIMVQGNHE